jgi:phosphopantetheinyl transferase (holo-ACP synthase)
MSLTLAKNSLGIDITNIGRFEQSSHLPKYIKRFNVEKFTALEAAKTWACLEALVKAEPESFDPTDIQIRFPQNSAPLVIDSKKLLKYDYLLSISHEGSMVVAVALGNLKGC